MLPSLVELTSPRAKRAREADAESPPGGGDETTTLDVFSEPSDASPAVFVACVTVKEDVRLLLERFLLWLRVEREEATFDRLRNVPNAKLWKEVTSLDTKIRFRVTVVGGVATCVATVDGGSAQHAVPLRPRRATHVDDLPHFFTETKIDLQTDSASGDGDVLSATVTLRDDLKCSLARFELVAGRHGSYWCNEPPLPATKWPVVAYARRVSSEATVPNALGWHQDRDRRGALLNFVRCTASEGSGTDVLFERTEATYMRSASLDERSKCKTCVPFFKNRTVVFNGAWWHRAPRSGGSREFLQIDLEDAPSNVLLVSAFLEFVRLGRC
jgi:hypothetical protein